MAKNRFSIENEQLKALQNQLNEMAGLTAVTRAIEETLLETKKYVTQEVDKAVKSSKFNFDRTGETKKSIDRTKEVEWDGTTALVKTGFKLRPPSGDINLTSIYLMYGTKPHNGNKGIEPDTKLRNAVKGEGVHRNNIYKIQREVFNKHIREVMK